MFRDLHKDIYSPIQGLKTSIEILVVAIIIALVLSKTFIVSSSLNCLTMIHGHYCGGDILNCNQAILLIMKEDMFYQSMDTT
jgi:hypothetical protein